MVVRKKLFFLVVCCFAGFAVLQAEKYTSKWDNINVDEILASDRLLENYKKCLMEEGKCTANGSELKRNLPDALKTECSKCTVKQKENTEKIINFMMENRKEWWKALQDKYDPTGIYYNRRQERLKAEKEKHKKENKSTDKQKEEEEEEEKQ